MSSEFLSYCILITKTLVYSVMILPVQLCCLMIASFSLQFTGRSANLLEWHNRRSIAIGIAKGLRFLHEECRGGPIIHRDLRPSNILLTHDFVPMVLCFQSSCYPCFHKFECQFF